MTPEKTIRDLILEASTALATNSGTARLDAEVLLAHALGCRRLDLISRSSDKIPEALCQNFFELVRRRLASEPVAYIVGSKEFWGLTFTVTPAVLIPRPETEHLVEQAVAETNRLNKQIKILDLGTGSGALIVAIAHELKRGGKNFRAVAIDKSNEALAVARENAVRVGVSDYIEFRESDWFTSVNETDFDIIVSNPPYIRTNESLALDLSFEPKEALFAGEDGLHDVRQIIDRAPRHLSAGGLLLIEIGDGQGEAILRISSPLKAKEIVRDLAGRQRVFRARKTVTGRSATHE